MIINYAKTFLMDIILVLICLGFFALAALGINETSNQIDRSLIFFITCYICFMTVLSFISSPKSEANL